MEAESNPFIDDELKFPPQVPKDTSYKSSAPKTYSMHRRHLEYSPEPTKVAPVKVASVSDTSPAIEPVAAPARATPRPVKQVKLETPSKKLIPKNPLRDE